MAKNFIAGAIEKPGSLHKEMGVPQGQAIPAKKLTKAASAPGILGKRARLAETLKGLGGGHKAQPLSPVKTGRGDFRMKG